MVDEAPEAAGVPDVFIEQVKQVLENLFRFPVLQAHTLAQYFPADSDHSAGQHLRRAVIDAIEQLNPGPNVSFRAPHARLYNILHMHYVQGLTIQEVAYELGISPRQVYRDIRQGHESVATVLWGSINQPDEAASEPTAHQVSSIQSEVAQLKTRRRVVDLCELLDYASQAVQRLAQENGVEIRLETPSAPVMIATDPVIARQIFVYLLSQAVQENQHATLPIALTQQHEDTASLVVDVAGFAIDKPEAMLGQLIEKVNWRISQQGQATVIDMASRNPLILVIDDNEGLVELLDRYLTNQACDVVTAQVGPDGLRLAQEIQPDAILLDVMMPDMDGWEILQRLRMNPATHAIPIVVCTVFNDPKLAYSLGASYFLPKPVKRDEVLAILKQLDVVP